jgi:hypothetical protein
MVELFRAQQQSDADLRELIKAQGVIMSSIKDVMMLIGGQGSFDQQYRRTQEARAGATFGKDG